MVLIHIKHVNYSSLVNGAWRQFTRGGQMCAGQYIHIYTDTTMFITQFLCRGWFQVYIIRTRILQICDVETEGNSVVMYSCVNDMCFRESVQIESLREWVLLGCNLNLVMVILIFVGCLVSSVRRSEWPRYDVLYSPRQVSSLSFVTIRMEKMLLKRNSLVIANAVSEQKDSVWLYWFSCIRVRLIPCSSRFSSTTTTDSITERTVAIAYKSL
jgi:hypothetical protein